jgi:sulfite reductase (NADPH) hemoprotein beta-component
LHAYMLRIAVPYGTLSSRQLRGLACEARKYDRGYGHFTTRQNLQLHWPKLVDVPAAMDELADVEMHCIQTSGNCIRNVTADQYAGAAADEVADPRPTCELIRQWSTLHPEFSFLPRKFKISVTGSSHDRAAIRCNDIGIQLVKNDAGELGYAFHVGGGQGRTPFIGHCINSFVPKGDLLGYLEAILRLYNEYGRRDNLWKARIKILVHHLGPQEFARQVDEEFGHISSQGDLKALEPEIARIEQYFAPPPFEPDAGDTRAIDERQKSDPAFARWLKHNTHPHKMAGYIIANISLKQIGMTPGDCTSEQMEAIADLAERCSFDEVRVSHEQNLVLPHVRKLDLVAVYDELKKHELATPNVGLISDIICCPGLDYCDLANARSIPIAQMISQRYADHARAEEIGEMRIKISGCINACGHHHVGHIGILGVDKKGTEYYQVTLGGASNEHAALGQIVGHAFKEEELPEAIDKIVDTYLDGRNSGESFLQFVKRAGLQPFKDKLYADH